MNRKHIVIPTKSFDLIGADSKKSGKSMYQIAGDIIACYYSGNSEVNSTLQGGILTENVNTTPASTPFFAQNGENSAQFCPKGEGGFNLNCTTDGTRSTISNNIIKDKLNKINNDDSKKRLTPKEYWEKLEEELLPYWIVWPKSGRVNWNSCKKVFHRVRRSKNVPSAPDFLGIVRHYQNKIWNSLVPSNPDYAPRLEKFLNEADWQRLSKFEIASIVSNRDINQKAVELLINEFKGVSNAQQSKQEQEKPQQKRLPISDIVPAAEDIMRMPSMEQMELASEYGYGIPIDDFIDAVKRRDHLRTRGNV